VCVCVCVCVRVRARAAFKLKKVIFVLYKFNMYLISNVLHMQIYIYLSHIFLKNQIKK